MSTSPIRIQLRRGSKPHWEQEPLLVLAQGEPAVIYTVRKDSQGNVIFKTTLDAQGNTVVTDIPQEDRVDRMVVGDGVRTIQQLLDEGGFYPIKKAAFNSAANNSAGMDRDPNDPTKTNATLQFEHFNDWLHAFNHPFAKPTFSSFTPSVYADQEVGTSYDPNKTYTWASNPLANVKPGSVLIEQNFNGATVTLASGLNGASPVPGLVISGKSLLVGSVLGQQAQFALRGRDTREGNMPAITRTLTWKGKVSWFMHDNSEWLVDNQMIKPGELAGTYQASDATVIGYCQNALNAAPAVLGSSTHEFGTITVDGGNGGKRLHLLYPKAYRSSFEVLDNVTKMPLAAIKTRELVINRDGVNVTYVLAVLMLKIVQQLTVIAK